MISEPSSTATCALWPKWLLPFFFVQPAAGSRSLTGPSFTDGGLTAACSSVASISVPWRTISPRASSWRLISSNSASASPCAANSWRKRQIVEWSGTPSSNGRPAKRRNDSRSSTASSRPGSDNPYHCCRSNSFTYKTVRKTHLPQITPRHDRHLIQFSSENHTAGSYAKISNDLKHYRSCCLECAVTAGVLVVLSALAIGGFLMFMKWL